MAERLCSWPSPAVDGGDAVREIDAPGAFHSGSIFQLLVAARAGRNEACFHAGNVLSAGLAASLALLLGSVGVFFGVALMAVGSAVSVLSSEKPILITL